MSPSKLFLAWILSILILSISIITKANIDCSGYGLDGREVNSNKKINKESIQREYYTIEINGITMIDFESFPDGCNINGINLGGVTLSNPNNGIVKILDNNCGSYYHSPTKVFYGSECSCKAPEPIIGRFDYPAKHIGLWGGDLGEDVDSWELEAFDAIEDGNSLGIVRSGNWNGNPYRKLEIDAPNIWRFEIKWTGTDCGISYDDLEFSFHRIALSKNDDINESDCVFPGKEINYTITYDYNGPGDTNVILIDYLPIEVNYVYFDPNTGWWDQNYNPGDHTYIWNIGNTLSDFNGTFMLHVYVNNLAEPNGIIKNGCEIIGDSINKTYEINTPVCIWNPGIVYVDFNRIYGRNNGLRWEDAYLDLQKALTKSKEGIGSEIWVAKGNYSPSILDPCVSSGGPTFKLINEVSLYGHFKGNETSIQQRELNDSNDETILSRGNNTYTYRVVTASGLSQNNILDGFTITGANNDAGIKIENAYLSVLNCLITNNSSRGVYAINSLFKVENSIIQYSGTGIQDNNSGFTITNCLIQNNSNGIYMILANNPYLPESIIENCIIQKNTGYDGIQLNQVAFPIIVKNNMINNNYRGIYISSCSQSLIIRDCEIFANSAVGILSSNSSAKIRNNTIVRNNGSGINCSGAAPLITNCIIWNHNDDLYNCNATYSDIEDNDGGLGNIHTDPGFVNADTNDFHLKTDSNCIDAGDPNFNDYTEKDIDGECRISYGRSAYRVDIGADELYRPRSDYDHNKIVNFFDYSIWSNYWQTMDPNGYLDFDNDVDIYDLAQFCTDWLLIDPL